MKIEGVTGRDLGAGRKKHATSTLAFLRAAMGMIGEQAPRQQPGQWKQGTGATLIRTHRLRRLYPFISCAARACRECSCLGQYGRCAMLVTTVAIKNN
jgi:hypothetical protein